MTAKTWMSKQIAGGENNRGKGKGQKVKRRQTRIRIINARLAENEGNTFEFPDLILDGGGAKGEIGQETHEIATNANVLIVCCESFIRGTHDRGLVELFEKPCFASERAQRDQKEMIRKIRNGREPRARETSPSRWSATLS